MKGLFIKAESMCCTQHMENNDAEKLRSLVVNDKDRSRIMADIYIYIYIYIYICLKTKFYCRMDWQMQNMRMIKARLDSLQTVWDKIVPSFHHWFKQRRS